MNKILIWTIADITAFIIIVVMFILSFPLHQWAWGWTSDKLDATILFAIMYLLARLHLKNG